MNKLMHEALTAAFEDQFKHLFEIFCINKIDKLDEHAIDEFKRGLGILMDAYSQTCLIIDNLTPEE